MCLTVLQKREKLEKDFERTNGLATMDYIPPEMPTSVTEEDQNDEHGLSSVLRQTTGIDDQSASATRKRKNLTQVIQRVPQSALLPRLLGMVAESPLRFKLYE